jgi:2-polyprenyl-3-methyl-5-hydroxy-6-metoxy-1,4-benzoquinol methylase
MMSMRPAGVTTRDAHEQKAWDEDEVFERCDAWVKRVIHVLESPNTQHGERVFEEMIAAVAPGARVLDVGCGSGEGANTLLAHQPAQITSIDISERMIATARAHVSDQRVEFRVQSTTQPLTERFDLITGRAILHHIDFREFISRTYRDNLLPGGRLLFMEPMGHPFAVAFHRLVRSAHSPDERVLRRSDIAWLKREFPNVSIHGINLLSFPAGILSSFLFRYADNRLMRGADRLDRGALELAPWLSAYSRQAAIVIDKPPRSPGPALS